MSEQLPKEPKLSAKDKLLDYIVDKLLPMEFVIANIDTPRDEEACTNE